MKLLLLLKKSTIHCNSFTQKNGNSIKFKNVYCQFYENGQLKYFKQHTKVFVIKAFNGELFVTIDEKNL